MNAIKARLLRSLALPALLTSPALAADMAVKTPPRPIPAAAPYNWTGFYVGLNAGGAWGNADPNTTTACSPAPGFTFSYFGCASVPVVDAAGTGSMSKAAFIGGGQAGYNLQSGNAVYGVEVDFNSFNLKTGRQVAGNFATSGSFVITSSASTTWLFTARGRVGWAFDTWLAYVTGGLALTDLGASNTYRDNVTGNGPGPGAGNWNASATKAGWTIGAGLEWAMARNWSAKVEYLYVQFGSITASGLIHGLGNAGYASAINTSVDLTAHIARAGINYKF